MASSDDENDSMDVSSRPVKTNYRKILDSDSSDDEKSEMKDPEGKSSNNTSKQLESDDEDTKSSKDENNQDPEETFEGKKHKKSKILDSDSSDDESHNKSNLDESLNESGNQKSKLIDSDSSDDEPQEKSSSNRRKGVPKKLDISKPKAKPQRKSAKAALDGIKDELNLKEISEKQKAERDREIKIPYHKPKQYSLKEFLARRTINKPSAPSPAQESKPTILKMKMNSEDLEKFAQKMKEREEEAMEFFKSESEDEEEKEAAAVTSSEVTEEKVEVPKEIADELDVPKEVIEEPKVPEEVPSVPEEPKVTEEVASVPIDEQKDEFDLLVGEELPKPPQETSEQPPSPGKENVSNQIQSPVKKPKELPALKTLEELSGKDVVIDLTTGSIQPKQLKGADLLFNRYLKTISKPKAKDTVKLNILSVENGKVENQRIEVKLDKKLELDHKRPGFSHEQLKEQLRNKVVQKRLEEVRKKTLLQPEPIELEPEDKCKTEENAESKVEGSSDEEYDPENDSDEMEWENEEEEIKEKKREKNDFVDDEAEDEDGDNEESEEESSSSESEEEDNEVNTEQKKGRILKAFVDSDDETEQQLKKADDIQSEEQIDPQTFRDKWQNFESQESEFTFSQPSVSQEVKKSDLKDLFDTQQSQPADDDLMMLCSGQFMSEKLTENFDSIPVSQLEGLSDLKELAADTDDFVTQVPEREEVPKESDGVELSEPPQSLSEAVVPSEAIQQTPIDSEPLIGSEVDKNAIRKLLESSDDEAEKPEKVKSKKKKKKRKQVKLGFSDDESDTEENLQDDLQDEEELEEEEEEIQNDEEVLIDYDSEENEIEVKVTEKQRVKLANEYFEKEAELSESEWGSADEDEKGLDKYEMDLADEEEFDQAKLREEVGRIHARKVMDDDLKNMKKIEDLLFENEENDGIGRERKFRWKNQAEGFTLEDENAQFGDNLENAEADDESEIMWRKMRHEREILISEQSQKADEIASEEILLLDQNSQTVSSASTSLLVKRKFQIIRTSSSTFGQLNNSGEKKESPFLIKNGKTNSTNNSFLSRDPKTLSRIASFMSNKPDDEITNLSSHGGNSMSFVPCEKPTNDAKKRKSEDNKKNENTKKRKVESQGFLLLDKLH